MKNILILHNLGSALNVGAIFRTADAIGIDKIYLTGYTPGVLDKYGRVNKKISKAAMGAEKFVKYEKIENIFKLIENLKNSNYQIIAIEQNKKSLDYKKIKLIEKNAFIFGSEVFGIEAEVLAKTHQVAEIKMQGKKNSLNVSTTVGIFLFKILDN